MDDAGASTPSQDIAAESPQVNTGFQSTMEAVFWQDIIGEDLEIWDHRRLISTLPEPLPILSDEDNYEEHVRHLLEPGPLFVPPLETTRLPATSPLESPFPSQETSFVPSQETTKLPAPSPLESPFPSQETSSTPATLNPATSLSRSPPSPTESPYSSPSVQNHPMTPETRPSPTQQDQDNRQIRAQEARAARVARRQENIGITEQPYPWATRRRARIQTMQYMQSNQINWIRGKVHCKRCWREYDMEYNLRQKLTEVCKFIAKEMRAMNGEAPEVWMTPVFPDCRFCGGRNSVKPVIVSLGRNRG